MEQFRFFEWQVYKDAKDLYKVLLTIVRDLPREFRYEIGNQIVRSGLSIILNIAEGSGKQSDRDRARFFDISLGSVYEVVAAMDVLKDNAFISDDTFNTVSQRARTICNQLGAMKKKFSNDNWK